MSVVRRPKLGQHFLVNPRFQRRLVELLDLCSTDLVIEIGAGRGALTELLADRAERVVALEVDPKLVAYLQQKWGNRRGIEICQADILKTDLVELCRRQGREKCVVFGNLPYYITSPILHHLVHFRTCIRALGLLMQREVAERITASPGSRDYGYQSVVMQLHYESRIALRVPPGAFHPRPQVHSAFVLFESASRFPHWTLAEEELFLDFVQRCFARKRKTLLNNLESSYSREKVERVLNELGLPRTIRAEEVSWQQFADLRANLERSFP